MIPQIAYNTPVRTKDFGSMSFASSELSRVFAAAVVNEQFREMLLCDPHQAIQAGFYGEAFSLSKEEQDLIVSIRADSLSDLARQVNRALSL